MIYDTGSLFQNTDFADRDATSRTCSRLESDIRTASKSCVLCYLSNHASDENNHISVPYDRKNPNLYQLCSENMKKLRDKLTASQFFQRTSKTLKTGKNE